jgi:uncharacterized membrane protein HdeD (DUF308 family)
MSIHSMRTAKDPLRHELNVVQRSWVWFLILGIVLILTGMIALRAEVLTTLTTVKVLSVLLLIGGVAQVLGAFWARRWSGFFALLLLGILYLVLGIVTLEHPVQFATELTLVIALFLVVGGAFRIVASLMLRFPNWGWLLVHGVATFLLGMLIWRHCPDAGLRVIGIFVGIELIFNGCTWVILALALRSITRAVR